MGASIGCQTISVMSSRNFHGPTSQLIFRHDCLVRGTPIPKKLISLNKVQKKITCSAVLLPTKNNETEGFKTKLISKLLLLLNKLLMFQLSVSIPFPSF